MGAFRRAGALAGWAHGGPPSRRIYRGGWNRCPWRFYCSLLLLLLLKLGWLLLRMVLRLLRLWLLLHPVVSVLVGGAPVTPVGRSLRPSC